MSMQQHLFDPPENGWVKKMNLEQHESENSARDRLRAGRDRQNCPGTQTPHTRKGSKG